MSERLHNIRFLHHPWQVPEGVEAEARAAFRQKIEQQDRIAAIAREFGGHVIQVIQDASPEETTGTEQTFALNTDYENFRDQLAELLQQHKGELPLIPTQRLSEIDDQKVDELFTGLRQGKSFVVAYTHYARGHGKYLVEQEEQLAALLRLQADFPHMATAFQNCEIRPFIKTPSDYATSFRVDVAPTGKVLSAGLIHATITEQQAGVITKDRWDDIVPDAKEIRFLKQHLEDPHSPYFLAARDIRSNASLGAKPQKNIIPLMGVGRLLELPEHQVRILDAYGIDPYDRKLPKAVEIAARPAGRLLGPHLDLVLGVDILVDQTGACVINDVNPNAGTSTFALCHPKDNAEDPYIRMRTEALRAISREFNS